MNEYKKYRSMALEAMSILEDIPDNVYPGFDEGITEAFNAIDDAVACLRWLDEKPISVVANKCTESDETQV